MHRGIAAALVLAVVGCSVGQQPTDRAHAQSDGPRSTSVAAEIPILDRTEASFRVWRHVGGGGFVRLPDGAVEGRGPLGMLWYPLREWGDVRVRLQWRSAGAGTCCANSGVLVRFPDPEQAVTDASRLKHRCQVGNARTAAPWVAILCGHEVQINDGGADPQGTASIYNFAPVPLAETRATRPGVWNDLEIRISGGGDYTVVASRNGTVLNMFRNRPGRSASRRGDPGTADRQFATGYLGLQNHDGPDAVQFRDVRVQVLG